MPIVTNGEAEKRLRIPCPFTGHNIAGDWYFVMSPMPRQGQMPNSEFLELVKAIDEMQTAYREHGMRTGDFYVVTSYRTPIAWRRYGYDDHSEPLETHYTVAKHSVTTSKHLAMVKRVWEV